MAKKDAFSLAQETADKYKNEILAELQGARITAETLSTVFETLKDHNLTDRDMMNDILKNALAKKEYITAFCIAYDPNTLDGKDAEYAGQEPMYDETGRYAPYWNKLSGNIDVEYLPDIDTQDWYIVPKTELHEYITDPYLYGLQGRTVMLTSLIFPIIHNGTFIGIISSDIVLDKLQEMVSNVNPHGQEGSTDIISNGGVVAAHPNEKYLGKDIADMLAENADSAKHTAEIKEAVKNGTLYIASNKDFYTVYMPIRFSDVTKPWSVAVSIPMAKILNNADSIRNYAVLVSLIAICVISVVLYIIAQSITKPLLVLSETAKTLGEGNFDIKIPDTRSNDEIGTLSKAIAFTIGKIRALIKEMRQYAKTLEEKNVALNEAMVAVIAANEARGRFMANVSHEIRTPLNAVIGLTNLLFKTALNTKQKDYTKKLQQSSTALLGIVDDILDFSEADSGNIKLKTVPFDIKKLFNDLATFFREKNPDSSIALRLELDAALPICLIGDPLYLRRVFTNLVDNAYKFTEEGSIVIRAAVSKCDQQEVLLDFAVEDTGIGMESKQIDKLFLAFNQADNSATRKYGGVGIGLATTREIVELMGGKITVTSEKGKGSAFTFSCSFPIADEADASDKDAKTVNDAVRAEGDENAVLQGLRVLLVEDNEINTMITEELLNAVGMEVTTAENGKEALSQLEETAKNHGYPPFDLVLMDLQMPVMDGYDATKIIKSMPEYKDMPVFALTAHAFPEERVRCLALGMQDHLTKPIDVDAFYRALRETRENSK
jgi:signal transduction histidine kinase/ActR/RegA family two-component response regulator